MEQRTRRKDADQTGDFRIIGTHTASNLLLITRLCGFGRSMCMHNHMLLHPSFCVAFQNRPAY